MGRNRVPECCSSGNKGKFCSRGVRERNWNAGGIIVTRRGSNRNEYWVNDV